MSAEYQALLAATDSMKGAMDQGWVVSSSMLIFLMQAGFALLESGSVRKRNQNTIVFKNVIDFSVGMLSWWLWGYGFFAGSESKMLGADDKAAFATVDPAYYSNYVFFGLFGTTAATIISGAVAGRMTLGSYIVMSIMMQSLLFPIAAHWVWNGGWLADLGFIDFAGGGVVHLTGGLAALICAFLVGPRQGMFEYQDGVMIKRYEGNSVVISAVGCLMLWFGWFGFNVGSTLGITDNLTNVALLAATNTVLAPCTGLLVGFVLMHYFKKRYDTWQVMNIVLASLAAVTSGCATMHPGGALVAGTLAAVGFLVWDSLLIRVRIDDPCGASAVHFVGGVIGLITTGLFSTQDRIDMAYGPGYVREHVGYQLGRQVTGMFALCGLTVGLVSLTMLALKFTLGYSVDKQQQFMGLDFLYHRGIFKSLQRRRADLKQQRLREQIVAERMGVDLADEDRKSRSRPTPKSRPGPPVRAPTYNRQVSDALSSVVSVSRPLSSGAARSEADEVELVDVKHTEEPVPEHEGPESKHKESTPSPAQVSAQVPPPVPAHHMPKRQETKHDEELEALDNRTM